MLTTSGINSSGVAAQLLHANPNAPLLQAGKIEPGSRQQKLAKAAQDFEGVLLSSLLQEVQKSNLDPSSASLGAGAETLRSLGTQAVAQALAQRGGIGIARMIVQHYSPAK